MAGRGRPPATEIDPDLATPAAKKTRLSEASPTATTSSSTTTTTSCTELSLESSEVLPSSDESFCEEEDKGKISVGPAAPPGPSTSTSSATKTTSQPQQEQQQPPGAPAGGAMGKEGGGYSSLEGEHALYQELSQIGDGAYGTVYKGKDAATGLVVALKKVRVPVTEDGLPTSTLREIAALKQLERFEHPQIVRMRVSPFFATA